MTIKSDSDTAIIKLTPEDIEKMGIIKITPGQISLAKDPKDGIGIRGELEIEVRDAKTDRLIRHDLIKNKVVDTGLDLVRDLMLGNNFAPTHIAVGTNNTAPVAGDTTLNTEVFRNVITRRIVASKQAKFQLFITSSEANGNTLVEAGIFNQATVGDMLSRVTFTDIIKTSALTVTLTWTITLSEA